MAASKEIINHLHQTLQAVLNEPISTEELDLIATALGQGITINQSSQTVEFKRGDYVVLGLTNVKHEVYYTAYTSIGIDDVFEKLADKRFEKITDRLKETKEARSYRNWTSHERFGQIEWPREFDKTPLIHNQVFGLSTKIKIDDVNGLVQAATSNIDNVSLTNFKITFQTETGLPLDVELCMMMPDQVKSNTPFSLYYSCGAFAFDLSENDSVPILETAKLSQSPIMVVKYPLAPEHSIREIYRACELAYLWVNQNKTSLNINNRELILSGFSAGGGIAIYLAGLAAKAKLENSSFPMPDLLYPVSPFSDFRFIEAEFADKFNDEIVIDPATGIDLHKDIGCTKNMLAIDVRWCMAGDDIRNSQLFHLFSEPELLRNFPKTILSAGQDDFLRASAEDLHKALLSAGATAELFFMNDAEALDKDGYQNMHENFFHETFQFGGGITPYVQHVNAMHQAKLTQEVELAKPVLKSKEFLIIANGPFAPGGFLREAAKGKTIVVIDGASNKVLKYGVEPDFITGDFDSIIEDNQESWFGVKPINLFKAPYAGKWGTMIVPTPNQELNDLAKAIKLCDAMGATQIDVVCALGGRRMDHHMANQRVLVGQHKPERPLMLHTTYETLRYSEGEKQKVVFNGKKGDSLGIMTFPAGKFKAEGLAWGDDKGKAFELEFAKYDSSSNYLTADQAEITTSGNIIISGPGQLPIHQIYRSLSDEEILVESLSDLQNTVLEVTFKTFKNLSPNMVDLKVVSHTSQQLKHLNDSDKLLVCGKDLSTLKPELLTDLVRHSIFTAPLIPTPAKVPSSKEPLSQPGRSSNN